MIQLSDYIEKDMVIFLDEASKEEVLKKLVDHAAVKKDLLAKSRFYQAVCDRENLVSTAIGMGIAIPHAKLAIYHEFFVAVAILQKGVEWSSPDDSLVRIVFLIGGPENRPTEYLKLLSSLTQILRDEQLRKKLMSAKSEEKVVSLLKNASRE